jgi:hypothetical protein
MSDPTVSSDAKAAESRAATPQSHRYGWASLALSLAALVCGVVPHFVFGEPLPNPLERPDRPPPAPIQIEIAAPQIVVNGIEVVEETREAIAEVQELSDKAKQTAAGLGDRAADLTQQARAGLSSRAKNWMRWGRGPGDIEPPVDALQPDNVLIGSEPPPSAANDPVAAEKAPAAVDPVPVVAAPAAPAPAVKPWTPSRTFLVTAMALAVLCIPVAMLSWVYERQRSLPIAALSCGCLALTWQYFAIGILIGAAAAAFLIVLALLGQILSP